MLAADLIHDLHRIRLPVDLIPIVGEKQVNDHNSDLDSLLDRLVSVGEPMRLSLDTPGDFANARTQCINLHFSHLHSAKRLATNAENCHAKVREFFMSLAIEAEELVAEAEKSVGEKLVAAGFGPQDRPRYHHNPVGAERAFDHQVKQSDEVVKARGAFHDAKNQAAVAGENQRYASNLAGRLYDRLAFLVAHPGEAIFYCPKGEWSQFPFRPDLRLPKWGGKPSHAAP
jgi:hypothetical protein